MEFDHGAYVILALIALYITMRVSIELDRKNATAYNNRGVAYRKEGR